MVSITHLSSVDSLLADGAWVGFRVLMLMPRKAWNVGLKPEYKTSITGLFNTHEPITKYVISSECRKTINKPIT